MEIGYCPSCNNIDGYNGNQICAKCGSKFLGLGVDISTWNMMNNDQMLNCINSAIAKDAKSGEPVKREPEPVSASVTKTKTAAKPTTGTNLVPGICPQCGGKIKVDKNLDAAVCEHCGTPFIVEKAINIVNNNIKLDSDDIDTFVDKIKDRDASLRDRVREAHKMLNQFYSLNNQTVKKQEELKRFRARSYTANGFLIGGLILILFGFIMFAAASMGSILFGVLCLGIAGFLIWTYIRKIPVEKAEKAEAIAVSEQEINSLARRTDDSYRKIAEILPELPEDYYDENTFAELDRIFTTNRADNMRQALAMIDELNHRQKMEEMERQNIELQRESNELQRQNLEVSKQHLETSRENLKAQKRGNKISAANTIVNTANFASNVYKIFK